MINLKFRINKFFLVPKFHLGTQLFVKFHFQKKKEDR